MTDFEKNEGKSASGNADKTFSKKKSDDLGDALRTAYDKTVNEDVPSELLDLLGKLK